MPGCESQVGRRRNANYLAAGDEMAQAALLALFIVAISKGGDENWTGLKGPLGVVTVCVAVVSLILAIAQMVVRSRILRSAKPFIEAADSPFNSKLAYGIGFTGLVSAICLSSTVSVGAIPIHNATINNPLDFDSGRQHVLLAMLIAHGVAKMTITIADSCAGDIIHPEALVVPNASARQRMADVSRAIAKMLAGFMQGLSALIILLNEQQPVQGFSSTYQYSVIYMVFFGFSAGAGVFVAGGELAANRLLCDEADDDARTLRANV